MSSETQAQPVAEQPHFKPWPGNDTKSISVQSYSLHSKNKGVKFSHIFLNM